MTIPSFEAALRAGVERFNSRDFFEAHEEWEERWLEEQGEVKRFLHGLIQIAAGFVKVGIGEWSSADGLFSEAEAKLEDFPEKAYGVELGPLLDAVARCHSDVRLILRGVLTSFDPAQIPQIELSEG